MFNQPETVELFALQVLLLVKASTVILLQHQVPGVGCSWQLVQVRLALLQQSIVCLGSDKRMPVHLLC